MGRTRTVDREQLLDAAEAIIETSGAAGLTIDAVAKAVGISKGGVQYCFGNKDALVDALFTRWGASYDRLFAQTMAGSTDPVDAVRAHVAATRRIDEASAKIRTGPPNDDDEDMSLDVWAGVIPVRTVLGAPEPDGVPPRPLPEGALAPPWAAAQP